MLPWLETNHPHPPAAPALALRAGPDLVGLEVLPGLEEPHALGLVLLRPAHLESPSHHANM